MKIVRQLVKIFMEILMKNCFRLFQILLVDYHAMWIPCHVDTIACAYHELLKPGFRNFDRSLRPLHVSIVSKSTNKILLIILWNAMVINELNSD